MPSPEGARIGDFTFGGVESEKFSKAAEGALKEIGAKNITRHPWLDTMYEMNDWAKNPLAQDFVKFIDHPGFREAFNSVAPDLAKMMNAVDPAIYGKIGGAPEILTNVRNIVAKEGFDGLKRAIEQGQVPVAIVGLVMASFGSLYNQRLQGG